MLAIDLVISPPLLTAARAGSRIPISSAMSPMTTSSSVMVNPRRRLCLVSKVIMAVILSQLG